jgi:hypothetical protein
MADQIVIRDVEDGDACGTCQGDELSTKPDACTTQADI